MAPLIVFAPDGKQPASLPAPKPYRAHSDTLSVSSHRSIPQSRLMTIDSGRITGYPDRIKLRKSCRQYFRSVSSAWGACTLAALPASRRSTHFKPLENLKAPTQQLLAGRPRGRVTSTVRAARPCKGRRIKRRIISCAQLGSRTYERRRTNQEVYYPPTGAKTE
jgi:hypothetical protein